MQQLQKAYGMPQAIADPCEPSALSDTLCGMLSLVCSAKQPKRARCWTAVLPVLYSVFSALVCTQSLIFNKAVMVLWRLMLAGDNQVSECRSCRSQDSN
jgi:hypothetical protein